MWVFSSALINKNYPGGCGIRLFWRQHIKVCLCMLITENGYKKFLEDNLLPCRKEFTSHKSDNLSAWNKTLVFCSPQVSMV